MSGRKRRKKKEKKIYEKTQFIWWCKKRDEQGIEEKIERWWDRVYTMNVDMFITINHESIEWHMDKNDDGLWWVQMNTIEWWYIDDGMLDSWFYCKIIIVIFFLSPSKFFSIWCIVYMCYVYVYICVSNKRLRMIIGRHLSDASACYFLLNVKLYL